MLDPFGALPDWMMIVGFMTFPLAFLVAFLWECFRGRNRKPENVTWTQWFFRDEPMPEHVIERRKRRQKPFWVVCGIIAILGSISMAEEFGTTKVVLFLVIGFPGFIGLCFLSGYIYERLLNRKPSHRGNYPVSRFKNGHDIFVPEEPPRRLPGNRSK